MVLEVRNVRHNQSRILRQSTWGQWLTPNIAANTPPKIISRRSDAQFFHHETRAQTYAIDYTEPFVHGVWSKPVGGSVRSTRIEIWHMAALQKGL